MPRSGVTGLRAALAFLGLGVLAACGTPAPKPAGPEVLVLAPSPYPTEALVGKWGVASFRNEEDRARTEKEARAQCSQPVVITKGPTDGVMTYVADDPKLYELKLKGTTVGRVFLGFEAPPGHAADREILSFSDDVIVMRFVTPSVAERYGTFIYVRCP